MGRPNCIIWLLCVLVCECVPVPDMVLPMHGIVQSPDFPQPYGPNLLKHWDLRVAEGYQIKLTFTHMDVEASRDCSYDAVVVLSDHQKALGKFCGQENSPDGNDPGNQPILSPGNKLSLVFQTDDTNSEQHKGFSAHYQAIDIDECTQLDPDSEPLCSHICHNTLGSYLCSCHHGYELRADKHTCVASCVGGLFSELEGHLSSPGFPDPSHYGLDCQYLISVEPGFTITLNFTSNFHIESIDVEQGSSCLYHWLQVTGVQDKEPVKLCGDQSPGLMATNSHTVTLDYHTDSEGLSNGWSLHYSTQRVSCPFPGSVTNGRVTPAFSQYLYRDYIHIRCDQGYKLMMSGQEINSSFVRCQSNGEWHLLPLPECQLINCGEPEGLLNGGITVISGSDYQYRSVIQYHCDEYFYSLFGEDSFTCAADRKWRDNNDGPVVPTCLPVCGKPRERTGHVARILGGKAAAPNTFPWQVLLNVNGRGGGIVIGDRWIMTVAHNLIQKGVLVDNAQVLVWAGNNDVDELIKGAPASIASLHVHHGYNNSNYDNFDNDIALIKLQNRFTFNSAIMPICLPPEDATYVNGELGLVSGFGVSKRNDKTVLENRLMFFTPPIVDKQTCINSLVGEKYRLTDNMICAGMSDGRSDSCQGDSGSALAISHQGYYSAVGIVSWGIDCNTPGKYGVYTKVANYLKWIKKTMDDNDA